MKLNSPTSHSTILHKKGIPLFMISVLSVTLLLCLGFTMLQPKAKASNEEERYPTIALGSKIVMPNKMMKGVDGVDYSVLSAIKPNGLLVVFSCNTCPFVLKWEDRYALLKKFCDKFNIGMLMINSNETKRDGDDSYTAMIQHAKDKNYTWPYVMDVNSEVANAFGAKTTPHTFLFDKTYKLVYKGAIDDNYESAASVKQQYVIDAITAIGMGTKIETPETKAVGCSVKRKVIE
jgi:thioredoxin-related protein